MREGLRMERIPGGPFYLEVWEPSVRGYEDTKEDISNTLEAHAGT